MKNKEKASSCFVTFLCEVELCEEEGSELSNEVFVLIELSNKCFGCEALRDKDDVSLILPVDAL